MAARALCKGEISFGLANSIPFQVFIAIQKADQPDGGGISKEKVGGRR
jgi:hypothetical protein